MKQNKNSCMEFRCDRYPEVHGLGYAVCKQKWILRKRRIDDYELIFQRKGNSLFWEEGRSYALHPGVILVLRPGMYHWAEAKDGCTFYYVHFFPGGEVHHTTTENILTNYPSMDETSSNQFAIANHTIRYFLPTFCSAGNMHDEFIMLFIRALQERDNPKCNRAFMLQSLLFQILAQVSRLFIEHAISLGKEILPFKKPFVVKKALEYIREHFSEPLQIQDLAREWGVTPQYLIRRFQQSQGISPLRYCNHYRIQRAKDLLRESSMSIKEIAYAVGLHNQYYFSRLFKSIEGVPPSVYRLYI